jgi:hypothetical protein
MIATPIPHNLELMVSGPRTHDKLHMSDIYGALYKRLDKDRYGDGPMNQVCVELGLAWETALEAALKVRPTFDGEQIERPGELLTAEGIAFNPDLLIVTTDPPKSLEDGWTGTVRVGEIKLKWMSSKDAPRVETSSFPSKYDKDFTQMKAYCYHVGTRFARYYVFYVNGQYKPPFPHEPYVWDIEFTQEELEDEWRMLLNFARSEGMLPRE